MLGLLRAENRRNAKLCSAVYLESVECRRRAGVGVDGNQVGDDVRAHDVELVCVGQRLQRARQQPAQRLDVVRLLNGADNECGAGALVRAGSLAREPSLSNLFAKLFIARLAKMRTLKA